MSTNRARASQTELSTQVSFLKLHNSVFVQLCSTLRTVTMIYCLEIIFNYAYGVPFNETIGLRNAFQPQSTQVEYSDSSTVTDFPINYESPVEVRSHASSFIYHDLALPI